MITLNIKNLCRQRGITHPFTALKRAGISAKVARAYLKQQKATFVVQHVEKLCHLLRCEPNDLFSWTPDQPADDFSGNPLQSIKHQRSFSLDEKLKAMNLQKIKELLG